MHMKEQLTQRLLELTQDRSAVTWTVEAFLSVGLLMAILLVASQSIPATNLAQEQSDLQQTQLQQDGQDVLGGLESTHELQEGLLYWSPENPDQNWHSPDGELTSNGEYAQYPDRHPHFTGFNLLTQDAVSYNVDLFYQNTDNDGTERQTLLYQGVPSSNSVVVQYQTILYDDDPLRNPDGSVMKHDDASCSGITNGNVTLGKMSSSPDCSYFMPDAFDSDSTDRYNVVRVRLVLWR